MATEKVVLPKINVLMKSGKPKEFEGALAVGIMQEIERGKAYGVNGIKFTIKDANQEFITFECLCGYEQIGTVETAIEKPECHPIDCEFLMSDGRHANPPIQPAFKQFDSFQEMIEAMRDKNHPEPKPKPAPDKIEVEELKPKNDKKETEQ